MKVLIALAFLAVAAARPDATPVVLPPAALPQVEEVGPASARPNLLVAEVPATNVKVVDAPLDAPVASVKVVDAPLEAPVSVEAVKVVDAPLEDVAAFKTEAEAPMDVVRVVEQPLDAPALQMIAPSELESIRVVDVPAEASIPTVDAVKVVDAPLDVAPVLQEVSQVRVVDAPELFQAPHPVKDYGNPLLRGQR